MLQRHQAGADAADASGLSRHVHAGCMVCGDVGDNPSSLRLAFSTAADGSVTASYRTHAQHQGYAGMLHGGMISTLLDAAMTHCLFARGIAAVTADLAVRFVAPVEIDRQVEVSARLIESRRRTFRLEARLTSGARLLARATARFIEPDRAGSRTPRRCG
jgi:uncharacterized protein (TIGR00369 family)